MDANEESWGQWLEGASRRKRWLVGVSGGADSVALLHMLVEAGFSKLVVCHLDHGLRGRASTADAKFTGRLAEELGLEFDTRRVEVKKLAKENGESMETAARRARHGFFGECAEKWRCVRVILAHHADDQAETVLWNLLRGSHGLRGMKPIQRMGGLELHRPLLEWRRRELRERLTIKRLKWRDDTTNLEPVAVRNRLRNEAIPLLDEISGRDVAAGLLRLAGDWKGQTAITDWALEKADVIDPQGRMHLGAMRKLPVALQRAALARFLTGHGVTGVDREVLEHGKHLIEAHVPAVINLPGGRRLRRRAGRIFVEANEEDAG